ncbi:glycosyltransferase family 87 protein [Flavobacterium wongokense]|uniref:glycosyltransferase family 87 protein n=1 Tax=Flavobacterium wongokense TaxID=2910674 RepID=UPI001F4656F5|nr:glycosyltransferase family 87 protein [Flavobacterium sp. WG47]MCF6131630.1 DUF2029 domain-containing protein [Flavobacterium sp. WG47]
MILKYYPFLPLLLLCGFYGYQAIDFPIHDFTNYYFGGKLLSEGTFNTQVYFPYQFNKAISGLGYQNIFANYAPNTPFLALFFLPFSLLSIVVSKLVFNCISIGLFATSIYRLFSFYRINPKLALLIPILFLVPIKNNLLFGQVYFLLFFLLAEGWLAYEKENCKAMAFFWSLAILLKVFPLLLLVFLLFKKQGKALLYIFGFCFSLLGISIFFTGIDCWKFYLAEVLPKASDGEIATAFEPNYQSVFMFLKQLLVFDLIENPKAFFNYPVLFSALMLAFKIGILTLGFFVSKWRYNVFFAFSFWVLAMILLSPYGSTYTFILLLFPFLVLMKSDISNIKKLTFCALLFLISNVPLSLFISNDFPFSYLRLFLLLLFFVLFVMELEQKINWKLIVAATLLPMILVLIFKKEEKVTSHIMLPDAPILIYNYKIANDNLVAECKDGNRRNGEVMPFDCNEVKLLSLKNNQVFYKNRQLTFDNSNKLKPMLIDHKAILYLSDYGRGIGFYTIRIIRLK